MSKRNESRRAFIKKAAYVAPAILTLQAYSALAKEGSNKEPGPLSRSEQAAKKRCERENRRRARRGEPPISC